MELSNQLQHIHVNQVWEKIGNKKELYDFLCQEFGAYLPKVNCTNIYFFRSILTGEKEYLKRCDVFVAPVPQIEGLTEDDFLEYALQKSSLLKYLLDQADWLHLDKKLITDVLLSLDTQGINEMILKAKQDRRQRLDQSQNSLVHMKPEFIFELNGSLNYCGKFIIPTYFCSAQREISILDEVKYKKKIQTTYSRREKVARGKYPSFKEKFLDQNKRVRDEKGMIKNQIDDFLNYKSLVLQLHEQGVIDGEGKVQGMDRILLNRMQTL